MSENEKSVMTAPDLVQELHGQMVEYETLKPQIKRLARLVEERGQVAWGELYLKRAVKDLGRYYYEVQPHVDDLIELVQNNQGKVGNPPAGMNALEVLVRYLEREWGDPPEPANPLRAKVVARGDED